MKEEFDFMRDVVVDESKRPVEYKFVELEITKTSWGVIYLKVPKDYEWHDIVKKGEHCIRKEGDEMDESDWDDTGTEYEVQGIKEVTEKEATMYPFSQVD